MLRFAGDRVRRRVWHGAWGCGGCGDLSVRLAGHRCGAHECKAAVASLGVRGM
jgi:hypothetical protein